jgi:hypothetical protein
VGEERGQPETGIWTSAAAPYPVQSGGYRPRRAKPEPPDPYLPRSEHPLRSGPYLRPGAGAADERSSGPRPDPLRDPFPAPGAPPDQAPSEGQAGQPVPGGAFGWWNSNGTFADDRNPEQTAREQTAREQIAREQIAEWHTGRRGTQDEPVPVRPRGAVAGGTQPDADRYPADFPTQVFMSSAQAAWQQPAQAAPDGNWPRIDAPPAPPAPRGQSGESGESGESEPAGPPGRRQPSGSAGPRRPPAASRPGGPRHATAAPPAPAGHPGWDRDPAAGAEHYPPTGAHRVPSRHQEAPFPPAQDPAQLYPASAGQAWPGGQSPPPRSRPPARRHGVRTGLLLGAAGLAALVAIALILFAALPG